MSDRAAMSVQFFLAGTGDTETLGACMAATRPAAAVVYLHGDLGAGKSTLARALLRALGVQGAIRSPTYTLVERYPLGRGALPRKASTDADPEGGDPDGRDPDDTTAPAVPAGEALHLDLYRIGGAGELEFLGLDDAAATLWLVEWPERGAGALPPPDLVVALAIEGEGRSAILSADTAEGQGWLDRITADGRLRPDPFVN